MKILVVGASGKVGSEVTKLLKGKGVTVRETTSQKAKANGQDKVFINLATGEGIKAAFSGVDGALLLSPPGYADHYAILSPLIQEAKRQALKKVVLMTALGANAVETTPFRRAEIELEKSGLAYNIVRPNWFMQNFSTLWLDSVKAGQIELPAAQAKTSFIDVHDIAAVIATLLTSNKFDNRDFDITGSESLTHAEVATLLGEKLGKQVRYVDLEPKVLLERFLSAGLPADYSEFLIAIFGFLAQGYNERRTDNVKLITGKNPVTFKEYAAQAF